MLTLQFVSRFPMIELVDTGRPSNQVEVTARMLSMTPGTVLSGALWINGPRMIALIVIQTITYLHMARETLELRSAYRERVTGRASQESFQIHMRLRQRPWRDLREQRRWNQHQ
jgi:hypothetical protein